MAKTHQVNKELCVTKAFQCLLTAENTYYVTQATEITSRAIAWVKLGELLGDETVSLVEK